ncbi:MAG: ATP-binding protein [Rhodocyclaceae bacterium]|nr:ATP-binding protein [Rhodocyclaceae bacterium]
MDEEHAPAAEVDRRLQLLAFDATERAALGTLKARLEARLAPLEARFSAFVEGDEALRRVRAMSRLATQAFHARHAEQLIALLVPDVSAARSAARHAIGVAHQRAGLDPFSFIAAYRLHFEYLWPELVAASEGDPERLALLARAFFKSVLLDIGFLVDAYFAADHERLRLLAKVFESDLEAVLILDAAGVIQEANHMAAPLLGMRGETVAGNALARFWSSANADAFAAVWENVQRGGVWQGEIWLRPVQGEDCRVRMSIAAVGNGELHYVVELADITEEWRAEQALAEKTAALEASNRELEQFAYVASHDLQEPLRMVASYTQLLGRRYKGKLDADADEFIAFAVDGAQRMQVLINDLLKYSRVGTRGKPFAMVSGEKMLDAALANLKVAIEESGAKIAREPMPELWGDETQLVQLMQNLIGNAIKFRKPGMAPQIRVSSQRRERAWEICVADDGIGIDPEYFDRIFVIFQRLHPKEKYPGSGIGLAIAKKIVERHGGRIWVESQPGAGATFRFTIPDRSREG